MVYLVGAGPGDPQLLTLRGAALLRRADVVVYDGLVSPDLLRLAPPAAERIERTEERFPDLAALGALLAARAGGGQCVVRLQGGDPRVSGQGGAEAQGLAAAGVPFQVVPGVASIASALDGSGAWVSEEPAPKTSNRREEMPLLGQRVVVTRARKQAFEFVQLLQERGAHVLEVPCIRIVPPKEREPLIEAIAGLGCYDWLIFTSANGVTAFFDHFFMAFDDLRDLGAVRLAAVGPATAARLKELHLKVDLMPKEYIASKIAKALSKEQSLENIRMLLLRAEAANADLPRLLEDMGAIVDDVACYGTAWETEDAAGHGALLAETGADWITFTSGSTVESFNARFDLPGLMRRFPKLRLATIGPETSKALEALSLHPSIEARTHTIEGLTSALERARQPDAPGRADEG